MHERSWRGGLAALAVATAAGLCAMPACINDDCTRTATCASPSSSSGVGGSTSVTTTSAAGGGGTGGATTTSTTGGGGDGGVGGTPIIEGVSSVAAGQVHTCAVVSGEVWCWGFKDSGQLGIGPSGGFEDFEEEPQRPVGLSGIFVQVAASDQSTCALSASGEVFCWGERYLGDGSLSDSEEPGAPALVSDVRSLSGNYGGHWCAVTQQDQLFCWGNNGSGQIGDGTKDTRAAPVLVPNLSNVDRVDVGFGSTCASTKQDTTFCWGFANGAGTLGLGNTTATDILTPTQQSPAGGRSLSLSRTHGCGVAANGVLRCWGNMAESVLGNNSLQPSLTPQAVSLPNVTKVATGDNFTCAISDGAAFCWGANEFGQLGDGTTLGSPQVQPVQGLPEVIDIAAGEGHVCAISAARELYCWGSNFYGQLAQSTSTGDNEELPVLVELPPVQ